MADSENNQVEHHSASQLKSHALCPRKHAFERRDRGDGGSSATRIGNAMHLALEWYGKNGRELPSDEVVRRMWEESREQSGVSDYEIQVALETAKRGLHIFDAVLDDIDAPQFERTFDRHIEGVRYRGAVDLGGFDGQTVKVIDHKSYSSRKHALNQDTIADDLQRVLYAREAFEQFPDAEYVECTWIYYPKKPEDEAFSVSVVSRRDEAFSDFLRLCKPESDAILEVGPNPEHREARYGEACRAFRGCPWKSECFQLPISGEIAVKTSDMIQKLRDAKQGTVEVAPTPVVPAPAKAPAKRAPAAKKATTDAVADIFVACINAGLDPVSTLEFVEAYRGSQ